jgi:hypothetical protein
MTDEPPAEFVAKFDPGFVSPVVAWLASPQSAAVTGRVFDVRGDRVALVESWRIGAEVLRDEPWDAAELGDVVADLVAKAAPNPDISGYVHEQEA